MKLFRLIAFAFKLSPLLRNIRMINQIVYNSNVCIDGAIWHDLLTSPDELRPQFTLSNGQCFNWIRLDMSNIWIGVIDKYPIAITQTQDTTLYSCLDPSVSHSEISQKLVDYFQLNYSLKELYELWATKCKRMKIITASLPGVRIVRQDPWECLCSFIFSSNNNIKRIHKGLQEIRRRYGKYICTLSQTIPAVNGSDITWRISTHPITDSSDNNKDTSSLYYNLYEFPDISTLAKLSEEDFRALGMGYRAKYMYNSIATIQSQGGVSWLYSLRTNTSINGSDTDNDIKLNNRDHANYVQSELVKLNGIGKKVADCIALFSLDVNDAIPVDTHVRDIVCRDYARNITKSKSLTPQIYNEIGNIFRTIFDVNAGWAHSVLFTAELDPFIKFLPLSLQNEMKAFNIEQKQMLKDSKKITSKKISGSSTIIDMDDTNMEIGEDNGIEEVANEKRKHHTKESQIKSHANKRKKT